MNMSSPAALSRHSGNSRHQRYAGGSDAVGASVAVKEERGDIFHPESQRQRQEDTGTGRRGQSDLAGLHHPAPLAGTMVVADYRLCGLRDGIACHEYERHYVAGN